MRKMMKSVVALALAVMLVAGPAAMGLEVASAATSAIVSVGPSAVYATPHLGSPVITNLGAGTAVSVISFDNNWAQISIAGLTGYMVTSYLSFAAQTLPPPMPMPTVPGVVATATVRSGPLNVHTAASLRAPVIAQLSTNQRVQLAYYDSNWAQVILSGGNTGYVVTSYLSFGAVVPTPRPSATGHPTAQTPGANATVQSANRGPVHLRANPSFDAEIITTYAYGSRIVVMSQKADWYYVKAGSNVGYMDSQYITLDSGVTIGADGKGYDAIVQNPTSGQVLHLRARPDTQAESLGTYHNGTYVEVLIPGLEWHHVVVDGTAGYMMAEYVHITTPNASTDMHVIGENGVELKATAATNGETVTTIPDGGIVSVLVPDDTWTKVRYTEDMVVRTGYVLTKALQRVVIDSIEVG